MTTFTAFSTVPGETRAQDLAMALERLTDPEPTGVGVFEIEGGLGTWEVGAFFEARPDHVALALLSAAFGATDFALSEVEETDWVAHVRRELHPVEAGRFFVHGSHDADRVPEGREGLLIEAAMAFGTGHHGTTMGCLQALDALADLTPPPGAVADIGCGTAVLAMAAARLFPTARVLAADIDPVAVDTARANVAANGLSGRIACFEAAGLGHPGLAAAAPFDLVLANILKGPLMALAPEIAAATAPGGRVILSGILTGQADELAGSYAEKGFNPDGRLDVVDWTTLILTKNGRK